MFLLIFLLLDAAAEVRDGLKFPLTFQSVPGSQRCSWEGNYNLDIMVQTSKGSWQLQETMAGNTQAS